MQLMLFPPHSASAKSKVSADTFLSPNCRGKSDRDTHTRSLSLLSVYASSESRRQKHWLYLRGVRGEMISINFHLPGLLALLANSRSNQEETEGREDQSSSDALCSTSEGFKEVGDYNLLRPYTELSEN